MEILSMEVVTQEVVAEIPAFEVKNTNEYGCVLSDSRVCLSADHKSESKPFKGR